MATKTKIFHLGDVLSVITGFIVSPEGTGGMRAILDFMLKHRNTAADITSRTAIPECGAFLIEQLPFLDPSSLPFAAVDDLRKIRETRRTRQRNAMILRWLTNLNTGHYGTTYGVTYCVKPLPRKTKTRNKRP